MSQPDSTAEALLETLQCETWAAFVERCAGDLARGGMYLPTTAPHTVWSVITVRLSLPAGHEIELRGRVVHVVDAAAAALKQMPPGVGVEFIDLDGPRAAALAQLLEYARTEGNLETPRYTFAQWLSTTAVSQGPSELMASLPPAPAAVQQPGSGAPQYTQPRRRRTDAPTDGRSATSRSTVRRREAPSVSQRPSQSAQQPQARTSQQPQARTSQQPQARTSQQPQARTSQQPPARNSLPPSAQTSQPPIAPEPKTEDMHSTPDAARLKLGMTHLAHRRYREARTVFDEMIANDPLDRDARLWLHMSDARAAAAADNVEAAVAHYRKLLVIDANNREAKDKIKAMQRNAKLGSIPFGRFFKK